MDDRCNRYEKQIQNAATVLIASAIVGLGLFIIGLAPFGGICFLIASVSALTIIANKLLLMLRE
ncbi:hypothetical protein CJ186_04015 [Actinomyces graevenitzii]|uniref:hypothetical protein n=1 Tax=Actinomyces graevenitzii TaxID=55565 RepID=UPI000C80E3CC|nr:hypothetical protein [Actinomyces graevenitzii]MBF0972353.1 hypothetical protein [Actinomyces graevenitzii]PMC91736.1 hypothetical protein CJ186_04015 [Actinomyces graevenitzii]